MKTKTTILPILSLLAALLLIADPRTSENYSIAADRQRGGPAAV